MGKHNRSVVIEKAQLPKVRKRQPPPARPLADTRRQMLERLETPDQHAWDGEDEAETPGRMIRPGVFCLSAETDVRTGSAR